MQANTIEQSNIARVNGVALHGAEEKLNLEQLRQRACSELLRQAAMCKDLLASNDRTSEDGVLSEAASDAIEALLDAELQVEEPTEPACLRYHAAHQVQYRTGERVEVRHILFAVTPGVDVSALRLRAETSLLDVRCHDGQSSNAIFAKAAQSLSNCPSAAQGGELDWLNQSDCAPEFAKEIFGQSEVGVLPRLVHSRFGFHVVQVLSREPGVAQSYEAVRGSVVMALKQKSYITALHLFLMNLATNAQLDGVQLEVLPQ